MLIDEQVAYLAAAGYMGGNRTRSTLDAIWRSLRDLDLVGMRVVYTANYNCEYTVIEPKLTSWGLHHLLKKDPEEVLEKIGNSDTPEHTIKGFAHLFIIDYLPRRALSRFLVSELELPRRAARSRWFHT